MYVALRQEKYTLCVFSYYWRMVKEFIDKKIALLWYGLEWASTLAFLRRQGVSDNQITVLDKKSLTDVPPGIMSVSGEHYLDWLEAYDIVFKTPGITKYMIEQARWDAVQLDRSRFTSQTQYFFDHYEGTVIGVTGTKGKSTTVSLILEMLRHAGKDVVLVGNVGTPVLDALDFNAPPEIVVYELSSFMLDALHTFTIDIWVFTSLYSTHTYEHGGYEPYVQAKFRLLTHATHCLIGSQLQEVTHDLPSFTSAIAGKQILWYGQTWTYTFADGFFWKEWHQLFSDQDMRLLGIHNRYNACCLLGVCDLLHLPYTFAQQALESFSWLEHRIEFVGTYGDIDRYNDAIATTPQATLAAIETFGDRLGTIFLWWSEGEYDFTQVAQALQTYQVRNVILFPDTWSRIRPLLNDTTISVLETRSMEEAVQFAYAHTLPGYVVLLSCGSPSFSLRSGYKEKWTQFKQSIVKFSHQS